MEQSDLLLLKREVLDQGPEAALPCNMPDKWLALLARDLEMLPLENDNSHSYLSAPLAVIAQLLLGKSVQKENEASFSVKELFKYLQYLEIEIAIEVARRGSDIDAAPATMETIFTNRVVYGYSRPLLGNACGRNKYPRHATSEEPSQAE